MSHGPPQPREANEPFYFVGRYGSPRPPRCAATPFTHGRGRAALRPHWVGSLVRRHHLLGSSRTRIPGGRAFLIPAPRSEPAEAERQVDQAAPAPGARREGGCAAAGGRGGGAGGAGRPGLRPTRRGGAARGAGARGRRRDAGRRSALGRLRGEPGGAARPRRRPRSCGLPKEGCGVAGRLEGRGERGHVVCGGRGRTKPAGARSPEEAAGGAGRLGSERRRRRVGSQPRAGPRWAGCAGAAAWVRGAPSPASCQVMLRKFPRFGSGSAVLLILRVLDSLHPNQSPSPNFNLSEAKRHLNRLKGLTQCRASAWVGTHRALFDAVKMQRCPHHLGHWNFTLRSPVVFKKAALKDDAVMQQDRKKVYRNIY
ncbi:uncharacterized protein [Vulpes vulpes]|uniref:Uncharacterized protein n=1 Tax=Vulpes vulpes TaxID=9627 RepID=A0ABM4XKK7_VULVU